MFVCVCNAISDTQVKDLARSGVHSAAGTYAALGCEPRCATCTDFIQKIIDTEVAQLADQSAA